MSRFNGSLWASRSEGDISSGVEVGGALECRPPTRGRASIDADLDPLHVIHRLHVIAADAELAIAQRDRSHLAGPKKKEGSAEALPSWNGLKPGACDSRGVGLRLTEAQLVEGRFAAVGGEVDGALRSVVDHERVAVQLGEPR
jgi:hypothetical protein